MAAAASPAPPAAPAAAPAAPAASAAASAPQPPALAVDGFAIARTDEAHADAKRRATLASSPPRQQPAGSGGGGTSSPPPSSSSPFPPPAIILGPPLSYTATPASPPPLRPPPSTSPLSPTTLFWEKQAIVAERSPVDVAVAAAVNPASSVDSDLHDEPEETGGAPRTATSTVVDIPFTFPEEGVLSTVKGVSIATATVADASVVDCEVDDQPETRATPAAMSVVGNPFVFPEEEDNAVRVERVGFVIAEVAPATSVDSRIDHHPPEEAGKAAPAAATTTMTGTGERFTSPLDEGEGLVEVDVVVVFPTAAIGPASVDSAINHPPDENELPAAMSAPVENRFVVAEEDAALLNDVVGFMNTPDKTGAGKA